MLKTAQQCTGAQERIEPTQEVRGNHSEDCSNQKNQKRKVYNKRDSPTSKKIYKAKTHEKKKKERKTKPLTNQSQKMLGAKLGKGIEGGSRGRGGREAPKKGDRKRKQS